MCGRGKLHFLYARLGVIKKNLNMPRFRIGHHKKWCGL